MQLDIYDAIDIRSALSTLISHIEENVPKDLHDHTGLRRYKELYDKFNQFTLSDSKGENPTIEYKKR